MRAHQVKRQHGTANEWKLPVLHANGVIAAARRHVAAGREYRFVSLVPARVLDELADRARRSDLQSFVSNMLTNKDLRSGFDYLSGDEVCGSPEAAWIMLRGTSAHAIDERDLRDTNAALAGLLLEGADPKLAAVGLGDLVPQNLAVELDGAKIESLLEEYGLRRAQLVGSPAVTQSATALLTSWRSSIQRELLSPPIARAETDEILTTLAGEDRLVFAVGAGGSGKSAVLHEVVNRAEQDGWTMLGFRLDRIAAPFSSTVELGQRLGLDRSPVSILAAVAGDPSLLVIDQLDAVSLASGRMPLTFEAVADLIREAGAFPEMRVLVACRKFDVDNDHRIRTLVEDRRAKRVDVPELSDEQVAARSKLWVSQQAA